MNLKFELPKREQLAARKYLSGEEILYCLPLDLNERLSFCEGYFVISETKVIIISEGEVTNSFKISDYSDYIVADLVSSGRLECRRNGQPVFIACFSMEHIGRYNYAQRILNEMASGEQSKVISDNNEPKCPRCGRAYKRHTKICFHCTSKAGSIKKIAGVVKQHWYLYATILLLFWLNAAVMLYQPLVNKYIVDRAIVPMSQGIIEKSFSLLLFYIVLIALCNFSVTLIGIARQLVSAEASARLARDLKTMVYNKIQSLSISYLDEQTVGNLMNRISRDTQRVQHFVQNIATQAVNEMFLFIGVAVVLLMYNWKMAALAIAPIPFVVFFSGIMRMKMHKLYRNQWRKMDKLNSLLNDILNGIRVVKAFGQEDRAIEQFRNNAAMVKDITTKVECIAYTIVPSIKLLMTIGSFLITFYGSRLVLGDTLSIGEFLQFSTYASYLYARLEWFSMLPRWLSEFANATERIFEVVDCEPDITECENPVKQKIKGEVSFKNVTFGYKSYQPVLKNVSIDVKSGEMIGIVGHSGAGKSTVINLLMRLYDADEGSISIDGTDIKNLSFDDYKSQIGVVLQETFLFSGTVLNNIRYAKPDATVEEVIRAAKIANAHDFIVNFPDGYDTRVGERGQRLSGGERQRIAIARAVLTDPKILILDEATASVDTETEQLIQQALARLIKGRTTFAIAHRLSTLKNADRLMVMDKGCLKELGTHDELMGKQGIYYTLIEAQKKMSAIKAL